MRNRATKLAVMIAFAAILCSFGIWFQREIQFSKVTYSLALPSDIPDEILLHPKRETPFRASAHDLYANSHRRGWDECLADFREGRLTADSEPVSKQQFGIEAEAEAVGYKDCKTELSRLIARHGRLRVRSANR